MDNKALEIVLKQLDKIETKVDKLDSRLDHQEVIAVKQEQNLCEHMRRTEILEKAQERFRHEVTPLLKAQAMFIGVVKLLIGLSFIFGLIAAIKKLI